jgi:hypothetical protein
LAVLLLGLIVIIIVFYACYCRKERPKKRGVVDTGVVPFGRDESIANGEVFLADETKMQVEQISEGEFYENE